MRFLSHVFWGLMLMLLLAMLTICPNVLNWIERGLKPDTLNDLYEHE